MSIENDDWMLEPLDCYEGLSAYDVHLPILLTEEEMVQFKQRVQNDIERHASR